MSIKPSLSPEKSVKETLCKMLKNEIQERDKQNSSPVREEFRKKINDSPPPKRPSSKAHERKKDEAITSTKNLAKKAEIKKSSTEKIEENGVERKVKPSEKRKNKRSSSKSSEKLQSPGKINERFIVTNKEFPMHEVEQKIKETLAGTFKSLEIKDSAIGKLLESKSKTVEKYPSQFTPQPFVKESPASNKISESTGPKKKSLSPPSELQSADFTTSIKSQLFLASKFKQEFDSIINSFCLSSDWIDLNNTILLLNQLNFIKNDPVSTSFEEERALVLKLWKLINGELRVKVQNLWSVCLNIMNLYMPSGYSEDATDKKLGTWKEIGGIQIFSHEEALKVHKMFFSFYENRRLTVKKKEVKQEMDKECSFKPKINKESVEIMTNARKRYGSVGTKEREEYLLKRKGETEKKREKNMIKQEEKELDQCSFQPTVMNSSFSKLGSSGKTGKSSTGKLENSEFFDSSNRKSEKNASPNINDNLSPQKLSEKPNSPVKVQRPASANRNTVKSPTKPTDTDSEKFTEPLFAPNLVKPKLKDNSSEFYTSKVQKEIKRMQQIREAKEKHDEKLQLKAHKKASSFFANNRKKQASPIRPEKLFPEKPQINLANSEVKCLEDKILYENAQEEPMKLISSPCEDAKNDYSPNTEEINLYEKIPDVEEIAVASINPLITDEDLLISDAKYPEESLQVDEPVTVSQPKVSISGLFIDAKDQANTVPASFLPPDIPAQLPTNKVFQLLNFIHNNSLPEGTAEELLKIFNLSNN